MGEENSVKLLGFWASPYLKRVELALRVKGVAFEYVEEDPFHPSHLLLEYNPIHKRIPVLLHNGKPVTESLYIIEYIDETWNHGPKLLPEDPYKRAIYRFWADYIYQLFETMGAIVVAHCGEQKKLLHQVQENLKILEEGIGKLFPEGKIPVLDGGDLSLLDVVIFTVLPGYKAVEEALGIKLLDPETIPLVYSWITALNELPIVKEIVPPHEKTVMFFKLVRAKGIVISRS